MESKQFSGLCYLKVDDKVPEVGGHYWDRMWNRVPEPGLEFGTNNAVVMYLL